MNVVNSVLQISVKNIENKIDNFVYGDRSNVVNKSLQNNTGQARGVLGSADMSSRSNRGSKSSANISGVPADSDPKPEDVEPATNPEAQDDPTSGEQFGIRDPEWFCKGMYIKMFAPNETGIHNKEFIILDSRNITGKGVRVDQLRRNELNSSLAGNAIRVVGFASGSSDEETRYPPQGSHSTRTTQIFLKRLGPDCEPPEERYARLDNTYNIPFSGHRCQDLGVLDASSLRNLRLQYIKYLAADWEIEDDLRNALARVSSPKFQRSNSSATQGSSAASMQASDGGSMRKTS